MLYCFFSSAARPKLSPIARPKISSPPTVRKPRVRKNVVRIPVNRFGTFSWKAVRQRQCWPVYFVSFSHNYRQEELIRPSQKESKQERPISDQGTALYLDRNQSNPNDLDMFEPEVQRELAVGTLLLFLMSTSMPGAGSTETMCSFAPTSRTTMWTTQSKNSNFCRSNKYFYMSGPRQ